MIAFILLGGLDDACRRRIDQFLCIPLVGSMAGLVASATHLGNPGNVLYVFTHIGSSPLSNEVAAAVVFLALAGVYWLYSFGTKPHIGLQKVWLVAIVASGLAFLISMAFAYDAATIISWNTVWVPVNLVLNSLVGGPIVAIMTMYLARKRERSVRGRGEGAHTPFSQKAETGDADAHDVVDGAIWLCVMIVLSAAALVVNIICLVCQNAELGSISNELTTVAALVPWYGAAIAAYGVLGAAGVVLSALRRSTAMVIIAVICVMVGIFLTRFGFYAMHLTVGLGM